MKNEVPQPYNGDFQDREISKEEIENALLRFGIIPKEAFDDDCPPEETDISVDIYLKKTDTGEVLSEEGMNLDFDTLKYFAIHSMEIKENFVYKVRQGEEVLISDLEAQSMRREILKVFVLHADMISRLVDYQTILEALKKSPPVTGPFEKIKMKAPYVFEEYHRQIIRDRIEATYKSYADGPSSVGGQLAEYLLLDSHYDDRIDTSDELDRRLKQWSLSSHS